MADLIDDVRKRLEHIKSEGLARTRRECINYLEIRIEALEQDIEVFGATANDTEQLAALKELRKEYKTLIKD